MVFDAVYKKIHLLQKIDKRYIDCCAYGIYGIIIAILYRHVLSSFWLYDDPYLIRFSAEHSPWEYFFIPDVWRKMSIVNITPWLSLSFDLDLWLFGFKPEFFYLHHLISIWLASIMLYKVLKIWAGHMAILGSVMFLFSAPVAFSAEVLMVRHYIEGLLLSFIAVYFFVTALRKQSVPYLLSSAVFYFFAMSAKELYVPLVVVAVFLPEGKLKQRIFYAIPLLSVLAVYIIWRHWMLGSLVSIPSGSGLSSSIGWHTIIKVHKYIYSSVVMLSGISMVGNYMNKFIAACLGFLVSLSCGFLLKNKRYSVLFFFIILSLVVFAVPWPLIEPSFAAKDFTSYRLVFLIAAYLSMVSVLSAKFLLTRAGNAGAENLKRGLKALIICTLLVLVGLVKWNTSLWIANERKVVLNPLIAEGKFFLKADKNMLLLTRPNSGAFYYYESLEFLRQVYYKEQSPLVIYNIFAFLDDPEASLLKNRKAFRYDPGTGMISEVSDSFALERSEYLSRLRRLPLSVRLLIDHGTFSASFGTVEAGRYFFLLGYKPGLYCTFADMGKSRQYNAKVLTGFRFYIRLGWESPEGWITFSPEWLIDLSKKQDIAWEQKGKT